MILSAKLLCRAFRLLGASPQTPTGAPPLDLAWKRPYPDPLTPKCLRAESPASSWAYAELSRRRVGGAELTAPIWHRRIGGAELSQSASTALCSQPLPPGDATGTGEACRWPGGGVVCRMGRVSLSRLEGPKKGSKLPSSIKHS